VARDLPVKHPAMTISPVHHRSDGQTSGGQCWWRNAHDLFDAITMRYCTGWLALRDLQ
jgi:hypothetical protein